MINNQKGVAFVLTLSIITLILLFIMVLFYQAINTSTQINTMEKHIDAKNIASMGMDYYQYHLENMQDELQQTLNNGGINELLSKINQLNNELRGKKEIDSNRYFELELPTSIPYSEGSIEIVIAYSSKGTAFAKTVEETSEITIKIKGNGE
ncbi:hypothetical protein [Ornithinibacillus sp. 179-J 7C1 HS]|uniref:hypothetical protein n=1 Tax=Ornithinibacillus sp. 179-J 7C1 HS TaxID=3142384 RepID=UPI00399FA289